MIRVCDALFVGWAFQTETDQIRLIQPNRLDLGRFVLFNKLSSTTDCKTTTKWISDWNQFDKSQPNQIDKIKKI